MNGGGEMFSWFSGLPDAVQAAIVTGVLAMITAITVALIQRGKKKKTQSGSSGATVQKNRTNTKQKLVIGKEAKIKGDVIQAGRDVKR